ncbi:hypothetical protein [uncultured Pseudosulfitobacter sp.]|tara:strand:- start:15221 stop:15361 length:141 start_codon:yes stop_codon:yes gene_type:complete
MSTFKLNLLEQGRATEWLASFVLLGIAVQASNDLNVCFLSKEMEHG